MGSDVAISQRLHSKFRRRLAIEPSRTLKAGLLRFGVKIVSVDAFDLVTMFDCDAYAICDHKLRELIAVDQNQFYGMLLFGTAIEVPFGLRR